MRKVKPILPLLFCVINLLFLEIKTTQINNQNVLYIHLFVFVIFFGFNKIKEMIKLNGHPITYYLSINIFRIIFSLLFLIPKTLQFDKEEKQYIINFFIIYFLYLFLEVFSLRSHNKK